MDAVELQVKTYIEDLSTQEDPGLLQDDTVLSYLGFDDYSCIALVNKLDAYVKSVKISASISRDDITPDITAGEVVDLVRKAIA
jgi:hypothetical protein